MPENIGSFTVTGYYRVFCRTADTLEYYSQPKEAASYGVCLRNPDVGGNFDVDCGPDQRAEYWNAISASGTDNWILYGRDGILKYGAAEIPTCSLGTRKTISTDSCGGHDCQRCPNSNCDPSSCGFYGEPIDDCYFVNSCDAGLVLTGLCCCSGTPILIDVDRSGFALTDASHGVSFDMAGAGSAVLMAWTRSGSTNAWLALDRNMNGRIDSGLELFGNMTNQPAPLLGERKNGFRALALYDEPENGGNKDGFIDAADLVFSQLRLWQDVDHDGISSPGELKPLAILGVARIALDYKASSRTDEYGNIFVYRAKVYDAHGTHADRWAWDVVPLLSNASAGRGCSATPR